jgi:hypothetical protein
LVDDTGYEADSNHAAWAFSGSSFDLVGDERRSPELAAF